MNTCPKCKATLPDGAHFCHTCGTTLDENIRPSYNNGLVPFVPASSGTITRVVPPVKRDWMQKLLTKCILATIATLAIAVLILLFHIWPGCFVSGALLLFALATTAACIALNIPEVSIDFVNQLGEDRACSLYNQIVNVTLIWEAFWLAVGLVCMFFPWWVVLIAESANISILAMIIGGILDSI